MVQGNSEVWGSNPILYHARACQKASLACEEVHDAIINWQA